MTDEANKLPVIQDDVDDGKPASCSPSIYISNEESVLLDAMRELRRRSTGVKDDLRSATGDERAHFEATLDTLRDEWRHLAARREKAYIRKMIMLGHLPPEADPDL